MADSFSTNSLKLTVLTPSKRVVESTCDNVYFPGADGIIGILPGHVPLVSAVGTGVLHYDQKNQTAFLAVSGGIAEVRDDQVTLLVDLAEDAAAIDVARAEKALVRAQERLGGRAQGDQTAELDVSRASEAAARARARLDAASRSAGTRNSVGV